MPCGSCWAKQLPPTLSLRGQAEVAILKKSCAATSNALSSKSTSRSTASGPYTGYSSRHAKSTACGSSTKNSPRTHSTASAASSTWRRRSGCWKPISLICDGSETRLRGANAVRSKSRWLNWTTCWTISAPLPSVLMRSSSAGTRRTSTTAC